MPNIDRSKPVLVTGATGYVAGWVIERLLAAGTTVHAAVRDPSNESKIAHLKTMADERNAEIKFFATDLLQAGSYQEAIQGCELVFHIASPFTSKFKDPVKELIEPAVAGTENVLGAASATGSVKRVVMTSSCAAISADSIECQDVPGGKLTEEIWNTAASVDYQPYSYSKTMAERKAWDIVNAQSQWDLVTINPSFVMGPPAGGGNAGSESMSVLKQYGDGTMRFGAPEIGIGAVDVRDVADAHIAAAYTPTASGRYLTSGHNTDILSMGRAIGAKYGNRYPLPKRAIPKWILWLFGPFVDRNLNRRMIERNVGIPWVADNTKIRTELGITFRPLEVTMQDGFQALIDQGVL